MPTAEVYCRHGLSPAAFYKLKSRYCGMEVSEAARLKALEEKKAKLKCLLADTGRSGAPVASELSALIRDQGKPGCIVGDHETEFTGTAILKKTDENEVPKHCIDPGQPQQNAFYTRSSPQVPNFQNHTGKRDFGSVPFHGLSRTVASRLPTRIYRCCDPHNQVADRPGGHPTDLIGCPVLDCRGRNITCVSPPFG